MTPRNRPRILSVAAPAATGSAALAALPVATPVPAPEPAPTRSRSRATARAAGKYAERLTVAWLRNQGATNAERRVAGARRDRGDVAGIPGVVVEVKSPGPQQPVRLAEWWDETVTERTNDNAELGVLVVRRRNRGSPADWFWVVDGTTMVALLRDAGRW